MKQRYQNQTNALRLMFWLFSLSCIAAAVLMNDRGQMLDGLWRICTTSGQITKSFFDSSYGGFAGAFLNVGLVGIICTLTFYLPNAKPNGVSVLAFYLTVGFSFWGITALNIWFGFPGVALYCFIKKQKLGQQANMMLFVSGLAPLFTDLLFRYPYEQWHGFTVVGVVAALAVSIFIGFLLPAGAVASPKAHRGFTLYSVALPIGITAFFLRCLLYKFMGGFLPAVKGVGLGDSFFWLCNIFCAVVFLMAILLGGILGGSAKGYWSLLKDSGHGVDYTQKYGVGNMMINFGVYGLFIVAYYDIIGANWNAVTLGCVFCMVCCCAAGSHPRNVSPIMIGYVLAGIVAHQIFFGLSEFPVSADSFITVNAQALAVGLCFANGLSPISGKYGWHWGIVAGALHCIFVTCVPDLHGGFCLYNGGLTAAFVCFLLVPVLEHFCETKEVKA